MNDVTTNDRHVIANIQAHMNTRACCLTLALALFRGQEARWLSRQSSCGNKLRQTHKTLGVRADNK